MKLERKDSQILEHIVRYCAEVQMAVNHFGKDRDRFASNPVFLNACSMPLLQIGKLAKRLSDELVAATPEIPWREIKGMRDFFAHDYRSMKKDLIWSTMIDGIPSLQQKCEKILQQDSDDPMN